MRRKLLAMDIDGTAVRDDSSLGEKSKEAIKLAQQEGHKIVFVSGRRDSDMGSLKDEQGLWIIRFLTLGERYYDVRIEKCFIMI